MNAPTAESIQALITNPPAVPTIMSPSLPNSSWKLSHAELATQPESAETVRQTALKIGLRDGNREMDERMNRMVEG